MMTSFDDIDIETTKISLEDLAEVLSAIANKSRLQLIESLLEGPNDFSELKEVVKLSKTALAHHLEKLVSYGILVNTSRGKYKLSEDGKVLFFAIKEAYIKSQVKKKMEAKRKADHIQRMYSVRKPDELEVQFIRLQPMRVVSFQAISESPENEAWAKLREWAEPKGYFDDLDKNPIYGFNNPNPSPGKKEYGYEFWLVVNPDFKSDEVEVKDVPESFNVVTRCNVEDPVRDITEAWKKILEWIKKHKIKFAGRCGIEKVIVPSHSGEGFILDIYIPVVEDSIPKDLR
ncbi:MAG: effector binding domain-containing protein [Candidatus Heimdallarchaeota archaeon]|nr:effector binding domain-containing protein [Candidatus Heimdallarchaeota archaeon]